MILFETTVITPCLIHPQRRATVRKEAAIVALERIAKKNRNQLFPIVHSK